MVVQTMTRKSPTRTQSTGARAQPRLLHVGITTCEFLILEYMR